jgi:hypothetical protein
MRSIHTRLAIGLALATCSLLSTPVLVRCYAAAPAETEALPRRGVVVDYFSDRPIAGAAVVVTWDMANPVTGGRTRKSTAAVSDQAGRFECPAPAGAFGPYSRPMMVVLAPGYGVFQTPHAAPGDQTVMLKARKDMQHDECEGSSYVPYEPDAELTELSRQVNEARAEMGLVPIDLTTGEPVGAGVTCPAPQPANQWGPFTGRVLDAKTGKPIPGAIFVVVWLINVPVLVDTVQYFNDARVAVADQGGNFELPRRWPSLLTLLIGPPHLVCVAPGYLPFHEVGAPHEPITVRLRTLPPDRHQPAWSWGPQLFWIPNTMLKEFESSINSKRRQLGLRPVAFAEKDLEWRRP